MFDVFRALFLLHEEVGHDWAIEQAYEDGRLFAKIRARFRENPAPAPADEALYESIREAIAEGEPQVARAFAMELARRLARAPTSPCGAFANPTEQVLVAPRPTSDHPHDYWVVSATEGRPTTGTAARFVPATGELAFPARGQALGAPWRLVPGEPVLWLKGPGLRHAEVQGWLVDDVWLDPDAARAHGRHGGWALARRSADPRTSDLSMVLDTLLDRRP